MSVNKFKVGDVVKCIDAGVYNNLTIGKDYVLLDVSDGGEIKVKNDKGGCFYYYSYRFELSNGSANAQQTHKSPKFKEGDMVYLIGFGCLKPRKLQTGFNNGSPMKFKVMVDDSNFETFTESGCYTTSDVEPSLVLAT